MGNLGHTQAQSWEVEGDKDEVHAPFPKVGKKAQNITCKANLGLCPQSHSPGRAPSPNWLGGFFGCQTRLHTLGMASVGKAGCLGTGKTVIFPCHSRHYLQNSLA